MKQSILLLVAFLLSGSVAFSQEINNMDGSETTLNAEQIIAKYNGFEGAVINMTRAEWDVIREWEHYSEEDARRIVKERKVVDEDERAARRAARLLASGGCECWVEPDDTYTQIQTDDWDETGGAGADVDAWIGPLALPGWSHDHYGENFNAVYINSKGSVSFGAGIIDWTPEEFPDATYDQIAGFWADIDIRATGEIWYKITEDAVYVNFIDVGYYNNHDDKTNTFQIIFTPEDSPVLPEGTNVQLCYLNMGWAHGDVGGSGGCQGPTPATNGADKSATTGPNIQYGRFGSCSDTYNGPYGDDNDEIDGVYWLNNKTFNFNTIGVQQNNIPPISTANVGCDTITLCLQDTLVLDFQFLAPENNQQVTIEYDVDGYEDGLYINNVINGNTATFDGGYVGSVDNIGFNTINVIATDSGDPEGVTELNIVVEVIDVVLPELTVSGDFTICAGSATTLEASDGFDFYDWSSGCTTPICDVTTGGQVIVVAGIDEGCTAETTVTIDQTPYFLPCVTVLPNPICSDELAVAQICEDEWELYTDISWEGDWNGLGGEVVSVADDNLSAELTPGTYRLLVTDEQGCQGQYVFNVLSVDPFIPEDTWSGAYCDGLEPVEFFGGFSNPAEGFFNIYLQSSNNDGWDGSFINVYVNEELVATFTSFSTFLIEQVAIEAGDYIEIEYISAGTGDEFNDVLFFNCSTNNQVDPEPPFTNGQILFEGEVGCTADPAIGVWTYISGPGGTFDPDDEFDTVFTPDDYGMHIFSFEEASCGIFYEYQLEFTEAPTIELSPDAFVLCGDEEAVVNADVYDLGGTAEIDWPSPGVDDVLTNTYSFDQATNETFTVTIENGCGEDSDTFDIIATSLPSAPVLEDQVLCDGGTVILDPIANDDPSLIYEWTFEGAAVGNGETFEAGETGTYCVTVSNECDPVGASACAEVSIAGELDTVLPQPYYAFCDSDGPYIMAANVPNLDWDVVWPDGSNGIQYEVTSNQEVCVDVTDPGNCATETICTEVFIGSAPNVDPFPTTPLTLCPEINNVFQLNSTGGPTQWVWEINCDGDIIYFEDNADDLTLNASDLGTECWGIVQTLTGTSINPCGSTQANFEVVIDACEITIPNIFTPNGDATNERFHIEGLDVYNDVQVYIYNRWGTSVYESQDYRSGDWDGRDVAEGTYWYVIILPNGKEHNGTVNISR
ncbi:gliding motility-associated C-terminal domain-containing protein [Sanyastnella coralliicola]|uniref:gliding motility-associated C-terminal domain-containing protein n=1 Tax=Sanyastnella coralliicola TaxID=3069118 RepID=UPI0027B8E9CD|nr:gliding motility-associated C-terminal domain-containing protein [Longitalea sp. SCSIO 12813]